MNRLPKTLLLITLLAGLLPAQDLATVLKKGQAVYAATCTGYCHGESGAAGSAPRLSGRGFDQAYITGVVTRGVPGTSMPAFNSGISAADRAAVIAYVASLNGIVSPSLGAAVSSTPATAKLTGEAARGRALFYDATRSFGRCSTCHEVDGVGIPVAAPIAKIPADVSALRALATPNVLNVTVAGESMPALILSRKAQSVVFYDLTVAPPVLRTVAASDIRIGEASPWRHASAIASYKDSELSPILVWLQASRAAKN